MSDSSTPDNSKDAVTLAIFNLGALQAQGLMRLSNALRNDPGVKDETRAAAESVFDTIQEMLDHLNTISQTAWGTGRND